MPRDAEGVPDVLEMMFERLKVEGEIDEEIEEPESMDWRLNQGQIGEWQEEAAKQYAFIPRQGELVLWVQEIPDKCEIHFQVETTSFRFRHIETDEWGAMPEWRAGVVTELALEPLEYEDLYLVGNKKRAVTYHGFRIETYPNPNDLYKGLSYQYKYVPLHHIRPFCFWNDVTVGYAPGEAHPSIHHALTITQGFVPVNRYRFNGKWPEAKIYTSACWMGHEVIVKGDAVRLMPDDDDETCAVHQVLHIRYMYLNFYDLNDRDEEKIGMCFMGFRYTTDVRRAYKPEGQEVPPEPVSKEVVDTTLPKSMKGYTWWHVDPPGYSVVTTVQKIMTRCYEAMAMEAWTKHQATINCNGSAMLYARQYSRQNDVRFQKCPTEWYWDDSRIGQLDLATWRLQKVAPYHPEDREPGVWKSILRIVDGKGTKRDYRVIDSDTYTDAPAGPSQPGSSQGLIAAARVPKPFDDEESGGGEEEDDVEGAEGAEGVEGVEDVDGGDETGKDGGEAATEGAATGQASEDSDDGDVGDTIQQIIDGQILPDVADEAGHDDGAHEQAQGPYGGSMNADDPVFDDAKGDSDDSMGESEPKRRRLDEPDE